jgi:hypothetical protein
VLLRHALAAPATLAEDVILLGAAVLARASRELVRELVRAEL